MFSRGMNDDGNMAQTVYLIQCKLCIERRGIVRLGRPHATRNTGNNEAMFVSSWVQARANIHWSILDPFLQAPRLVLPVNSPKLFVWDDHQKYSGLIPNVHRPHMTHEAGPS
jgi:hypothetical protein